MPITLVSGLPGAGKSLRLVQLIREAVNAGRPVYVHGLDGLVPFGWESCDARQWQELPDGSLVVIDEVQKVWPSRRSGEPSEDVRALSEHRHRGFDFLLATQHPTMVDSYVRRLVGAHEHVVRQFGAKASKIVGWQECQDDPQSLATRQRGTVRLWKYPSDCFGLYQSATLHTVRAKIPVRLLMLPVAVLVSVAAIVMGYRTITALGSTSADATAPIPQGSPQVASSVAAAAPVQKGKYGDAGGYLVAFTPRIAGMPWSAPVFDDRSVAAQPDLLCVASEAKGCQCYTEQITRVSVPVLECMKIARFGIYNPFRKPEAEGETVASGAAVGG